MPKAKSSFNLNSFVSELQKLRPESGVQILSDQNANSGVYVPWWIPTGIPNMDWVMGGGVPGGRIVEIFSNAPSEGKSSVLQQIAASGQQYGALVILLDSETGSLTDRMVSMGVDPDNLIFDPPDFLEDGFDLIDTTIRKARTDGFEGPILALWDSIGGAPSKDDFEATYDKKSIGSQARVFSSALKKLAPILRKSQATVVATNQVRERLNAMPWGDQRESVGGLGFKFWAHMRLALKRIGNIKDGDKVVGIRTEIHGKKNKVSVPFRKTVIEINNESGIDLVAADMEWALICGVLKESRKGFYSWTGSEKAFRAAQYEANMTEETRAALDKELRKLRGEEVEVEAEEVTVG